MQSLQDRYAPQNRCFGCGPSNDKGLRIKSYVEGDEVIAVDGTPVGDLSPTDVHVRMEGVVGSKIVLLVVRNGETLRVQIVRGPLEKP